MFIYLFLFLYLQLHLQSVLMLLTNRKHYFWVATRHVARHLNGGENNNLVSTFKYLMPLVFKAYCINVYLSGVYFLNSCVQTYVGK